jgi:hypothetical protein
LVFQLWIILIAFYYNIDIKKRRNGKEWRGKGFFIVIYYFSEKEGFLIVKVEYNLKVSSIYYFPLSYSFPNIKVSCIVHKGKNGA